MVFVGVAAQAGKTNDPCKLRLGSSVVCFQPENDAALRRASAEVMVFLNKERADSKHERRGLQEVVRLASAALASRDGEERARLDRDLRETAVAIHNLDRPTIPRRFDTVMLPVFLHQLCRPIGVGEKPAVNLQAGPKDLSLCDPLPSSFWTRPADIAGENLAVGFGRTEAPRYGQVFQYAAAKETSGMNPGFEVEWHGERVKLKFGEVSSEPFVARIFWAMGFHVDATDYAPGVKVAYDRRIFTEFNSRQPVRTTFTALGFIPVYTMDLQHRADPFRYVAKAVLRDGREWSGSELRSHLLASTNFAPEAEAQIDYLVTAPANTQVKDARAKTIGPWDYGQLDHADLRELRGAGLLAAWVGFYDCRFDNTKLRLVGSKRHAELVHYFSDLGGGLGRTTGFLSWHGENVNAFPWTFTAPPLEQGPHELARPLRIVGYKPVVRNAAFAAMTIDDARWMARLIGQLRVEQIRAALQASGYDAATVDLYVRKLISRRNKMMIDLGVAGECPPLPENPEVRAKN